MDQEDVAEQVDRNARNSTLLEWSVRVGFLAYGLIHLLIAWVAVRLVLAGGSGSATGQGALAQLADDPAGKATLVAMSVGFAALVVWQTIVALVGFRDRSGRRRALERLGAAARAITYTYFAISSARMAFAGSSGSGASPETLTARLMSAPAGPILVVILGLVVAGIGIGLAVFGLTKGFVQQLDETARNRGRRTPIITLGMIGYVVKGAAFVVIGTLFCWAGLSHDPDKSGGLDQALQEFLGNTAGTVAVVVAGAGIGCFGVYLFVVSRHIDNDSITS